MIKSDYLVPVTVDTALKLNNKASRNALIFLDLDTDPSVGILYPVEVSNVVVPVAHYLKCLSPP